MQPLLSVWSYVVARLQTKPREAQDKHLADTLVCVKVLLFWRHLSLVRNVCLLSCATDGGLEGKGDVVSCMVEVGV